MITRKKELMLGTKIELEHRHLFPKRFQKRMAKRIALDHIHEFPHYYSQGLIPLERKLKMKRR